MLVTLIIVKRQLWNGKQNADSGELMLVQCSVLRFA